ncbi:hypothetical protein MJG53_001974 [Ovis ammon polii x Ovis aries]|uniref:Uncharacterized protein n=2 Tax=Ovis TaxID=9935 RepID=A0A836D7X4_SHEEP|nr:hypothetical protein JEQ12_000366 [Ovis aries]KAI4590925.1 hypothetical protein MJG53_001974 [Ovis ammon polii x Ovis aries]
MTKTWRSGDLQQALLPSRLILTFPELDVFENTVMAPVGPPLACQHHPGAGAPGGSQVAGDIPLGLVRELMQAHLPCKLAGVAYHPALCAHLAAVLSAEIQDLVRAVTLPHYRLVCSIGTGGKGQDSYSPILSPPSRMPVGASATSWDG